jgi:hypothetical protein
VRGLAELEAAAPRAARVFLFLLPRGRPRRRGGEGAATAAAAVFLPLPLGRPGPRLFRTPSPPRARAAPSAVVVVGAAAAAAARATRVFWLRLPFGRPRFRDAGGVITGVSVFFPLPFGRSGPCFSGTPSPLVTEPPREDMAGQNSEEKVEAEEEGECALNPKVLSVFKEGRRGEEGVRSMVPDALVTAPHRACLREGNRCGCHSGSWEEPTGCAADSCQSTPHDDLGSYYGGSKV